MGRLRTAYETRGSASPSHNMDLTAESGTISAKSSEISHDNTPSDSWEGPVLTTVTPTFTGRRELASAAFYSTTPPQFDRVTGTMGSKAAP